MSLNPSSVRRAAIRLGMWGTFSVAACGVTEHPHATQAIDTSNDFGPSTEAMPAAPGVTETAAPVGSVNPSEASMNGAGIAEAPGVLPLAPSAEPAGAAEPTGTQPALPTPSGVTIDLGGVEVPKERAIAFIHIGHSNMAGRASRPNSSRPFHFQETHPRAWLYHPGSPPELALEPNTAGDTANAGPGTALVKEAAMLAAPDYYFISLGFGYPSAYCSQFLPSGLYYDQLIAGPLAIKDRVTFGGIFIYLGITERHGTEADRTRFPNCINELVTAIRNDVGVPDLPLLINDYEVEGTGEFQVGGEVANAIMPQIAKIPSTVTNSALVSAEGLGMQDNHHFNLDGHRVWVQRALAIMQDKGWVPWTQP
jgi:carbohydrate esterase-like sialic acid-specific acetylesterase